MGSTEHSAESCVLDAVFSGAGAGLCLLDPRGKVLRANADWIDGALLTGQDVIGKNFWDLFPEAPPQLRKLHEQVRRGEAIDVPRRAFGQTGREPWHTSKLTPVPFANGVGILLTAFNGLGRTPSEEAIRARDDRLRAVLDTMLEGCQLIGRDWRFLYVNEAGANHNRVRSEDVIGRTMGEVFPGFEQMPLFRSLERCMNDGTPQRFENQFTFPDGSTGWFDISVEPQPDGIFILSVDITERKRAENALHAVRDQLTAVVQASPVPIVVTDADFRVLLWSAAAERLFGWSAAEVVGQMLPIISEAHIAEIHDMRDKVSCGQRVTGFVTTRFARDGRAIPVSISAGGLAADDGALKGVVVLLTDLTQQTAMRKALVESESRFAAAFEATPLPKVMMRMADRVVVEINPACLEALAVTRAEVIGRSVSLMPVDEATDREEFWDVLDRDGRVSNLEIRYRPVGKGEREATVSAERILMGGEEYALVVMQDITERKQVERALQESDALFRQLADAIEEVFWLTDMAKSELIYVSPGYQVIWGRSCESLYANPREWIDAIHPEDRERVALAAQTKQALGIYDEEYRIVRPDGAMRWIRSRAFPVRSADGQVIRIAVTAQDITSRCELEAQLRQTQKMESIGLLAGGVAHDFNNVLTTIAGTCDALSELLPPERETAELVDEIRKAGERATALTRQLLAFSRREVVEVRVVDLAAIVADTQKMLVRLLGEDVVLTLSLGIEPTSVKVDTGSWVQVLMNLAINARDAMPRGGALAIETRAVVVDATSARSHPISLRPGRYVTLSVTDTGFGMTPEVQARIFEPFYTTKGVEAGTGLGLSVVHGIVAQSGGVIDVSSEVGKGTTFRIYVPTVEAPAALVPAITRERDHAGSETILVVEDEPAIRRVVIRALSKLGYAVLQAGNGVEAMAVVDAHRGPIDLLVTDVVMPYMDGRELAEALLARFSDLRVLYTSGYTDDAIVRHGIQHAEVEFLAKPYDLTSLRRKVRDVLDDPRVQG